MTSMVWDQLITFSDNDGNGNEYRTITRCCGELHDAAVKLTDKEKTLKIIHLLNWY